MPPLTFTPARTPPFHPSRNPLRPGAGGRRPAAEGSVESQASPGAAMSIAVPPASLLLAAPSTTTVPGVGAILATWMFARHVATTMTPGLDAADEPGAAANPQRTSPCPGAPKMSEPSAIFEQTSKTTGHSNELRFE